MIGTVTHLKEILFICTYKTAGAQERIHGLIRTAEHGRESSARITPLAKLIFTEVNL